MPPKRHELSAEPLIFYLDVFATPTECRHLINRATASLEPALVEADGAGLARPSIRTGAACWLAARGDPLLEALEDRICAVVGCAEEATEFFHVVRYKAGSTEQYKPHLDAHDLTTARGKRATARGGQRLTTALLYLSTVESGGHTVFPELGLHCTPQLGRLLVFHNCKPGSSDADPRLRHAGEPAGGSASIGGDGGGDKWICNKWVRETPLRARRGSMMAHLYGEPRAEPAYLPTAAGTADGAGESAESDSGQIGGGGAVGGAAGVSRGSSGAGLLEVARAWKRQRATEGSKDDTTYEIM